jgi:putative thioredoxin
MSPFSIAVNGAEFEEAVISASRKLPVLVDFWAPWCAPCRTLKPVLEKLAAEYGGRFLLAKIDSDRNQELAARYHVRGIPNVKAFVDGVVVDEFSGALAETQVRAFIDRLLPSPAEPLRIAAREARAAGDLALAHSLLIDARELDPADEAVLLDLAEYTLDLQQPAEAAKILDPLEHTARDAARCAALRARLKLVAAGTGIDPAEFQARIAVDPDDLEARLQLATSLALSHDYRPALEQLLDIVCRDRNWQDHAARKAMLDLFVLLGDDSQFDDLVREFRVRLARTLN